MLRYTNIDIFTSEEARYLNRPVSEAVVHYVQEQKLAARCLVSQGVAGCYENGDIATRNLELLSFNMPIKITIVLPSAEVHLIMDQLVQICEDSIISSHEILVHSHRMAGGFFPRQLRVRDMMTSQPQYVHLSDGADHAARLLLNSIFTGLPVVDKKGKPVGIITQGDLIERAGLPIRIKLLEHSDDSIQEPIFQKLSQKTAQEIMTSQPITIGEDLPLSEGVDLMLEQGVKRLPVVNAAGKLVGILSRLDIFRTVMHRAPNWNSFRAQEIEVSHIRNVGDVLRRDSRAVNPDSSVEDLIHTINTDDLQMVAVVDENNLLLGTVSDMDLLYFFQREEGGVLGLLGRLKKSFSGESESPGLARRLRETTAGMVMSTKPVTVPETILVEEAISLMTTHAIKRLLVTDEDGHFLGMISRDSLLRTGYHHTDSGDRR